MENERSSKDDPVEGSREVIDEELKKQAEQSRRPATDNRGSGEPGPKPTDAD